VISVLYVDDEPPLLTLAQTFLEMTGDFSVTTANSVDEGLDILQDSSVDAIVSDYQMPGKDGIQFLREVRALPDFRPFIIFTGRGREEIVIDAINSGADFYLQKGGNPKAQFVELAHKIRQAVRRYEAEQGIRFNERRLRQIIDLVPHFIFAKDDAGKFLLANQAVADAYGTSVEDLLGKTDADFVKSPEELKNFRDADLDVIRSGKRRVIDEEPITDSLGNVRILSTVKIPFTSSGTLAPAILGVSIDITERKRVQDELLQKHEELQAAHEELIAQEEELRENYEELKQSQIALRDSECRYQNLFDHASDGIAIAQDGRFRTINARFAGMMGYSAEELIGQPIHMIIHPEDKGLVTGRHYDRTRKGAEDLPQIYQFRGFTKQGTVKWLELNTSVIDWGGTPATLNIMRDVTWRMNRDTPDIPFS